VIHPLIGWFATTQCTPTEAAAIFLAFTYWQLGEYREYQKGLYGDSTDSPAETIGDFMEYFAGVLIGLASKK
jgi:hypothetical protein